MNSDPGYQPLKEFIIGHTGLAYYQDKDSLLRDRLAQRMAHYHLADCSRYLALLQQGQAGGEMDTLVAELTIGESYFFRYPEQFTALRETVIPALLRQNADTGSLRIWSVGCAKGEEPYSLNILLQDHFAAQLAGWDVTLIATDINRSFLAQAQEGRFAAWAFRTNPESFCQTHFIPLGKEWQIQSHYQQNIVFQYHNLVRHPFPSQVQNLCAFDLILCRNVMIYFDQATLDQILPQFLASLRPGGWFVTGYAELPPDQGYGFTLVQLEAGLFFYRKDPDPRPDSLLQPSWQPAALPEWTPTLLSAPPPAPVPHSTAIRASLNQGQWEQALISCREWLAGDRLNPEGHFLLALALEQQGDLPGAEKSLRQALYLDRRDLMIHYHLGLLLQKQGDCPGALRAFRNVVKLAASQPIGQEIPFADGLTGADLGELALMQLEVLAPC